MAALWVGCVRAPPLPPVAPGASPEALSGTVWWHRPGDEGRCLDWTFVQKGEGGVHLERRDVEEEDGWRREVRTFYSLARESGGTVMYAPGYEYRWLRDPGPDAQSFPGQRAPLGYVAPFCVLGDDGRRIEWVEAACGATAGAAVQRWYRGEAACLASLHE